MARKLKTYITSVGFFEEAIAAPSMKAAADAWGTDRDLFHKGFAKETSDPAIVAATMSQPGIILKRPVGTKGPFKKLAKLPKADLIDIKSPAAGSHTKEKQPKKPAVKTQKQQRVATGAYAREKKLQEKQRQKDNAARKKQKKNKDAAIASAERSLKESQTRHDREIKILMQRQATINDAIEAQETKWQANRKRLEAAIQKAKDM